MHRAISAGDILGTAARRALLEAEGFSRRTANALSLHLHFSAIEELRTARWGDGTPEDGGLLRQLKIMPGLGSKGVAEVETWRAGRHPSTARLLGPVKLTLPIGDEQLASLDAWIARCPDPKPSRLEAIRLMVERGLREPPPAEFQRQVKL